MYPVVGSIDRGHWYQVSIVICQLKIHGSLVKKPLWHENNTSLLDRKSPLRLWFWKKPIISEMPLASFQFFHLPHFFLQSALLSAVSPFGIFLHILYAYISPVSSGSLRSDHGKKGWRLIKETQQIWYQFLIFLALYRSFLFDWMNRRHY